MDSVILDGVDMDFTPGDVSMRGNGFLVHKLGSDDQLLVRFYEKNIPVPFKSQNGTIVFENQDYVEIIRPGDKSQIVDRKARDADKARFPLHWQRYKTGKSQTIGTSINKLFEQGLINQPELEMLQIAKVHTVEQLAAASEVVIDGFGPSGQKLQNYAKGFLNHYAKFEGKLDIDKLRTEMEAGKIELQKNLDEVVRLKELLLNQVNEPIKKRGSKAKSKEVETNHDS